MRFRHCGKKTAGRADTIDALPNLHRRARPTRRILAATVASTSRFAYRVGVIFAAAAIAAPLWGCAAKSIDKPMGLGEVGAGPGRDRRCG